MPGGKWVSMDKIRPGAYINFVGVTQPTMTVGSRGIGTLAIPLSWGDEQSLIDVYSTDLLDGTSLSKIGFTIFDNESKILKLMLTNCYMAKVKRLNTNGVKATGTHENLTITARYSGTFGNKITIVVTENEDFFDVLTFVNGSMKDKQTIKTIENLVPNDFVIFSGSGTLSLTAGVLLTGGTDGTYTPSVAYADYLALASKARWQTMALTQDNAQFASVFSEFADTMRDQEGKYVQVVVANYDADTISTIVSKYNLLTADGVLTAEELTAWIAGITAGAQVNESNIGRKFPNAISIVDEPSSKEIEDDLRKGKFVFSVNQRGEIVVEHDINSLHTFTAETPEDWQINQVVRVMDETGTTEKDIWEQSFMGKVQNNENGRNIFKSTLISYYKQLQELGAITDFNGTDDVIVEKGRNIGDVRADSYIRPVSAQSKLYKITYLKS